MKKVVLLLALLPLVIYSQTQIGNDIYGENAGDNSGESSIVKSSSDGTIIAVGSMFNDGNGNNSGHVRVFENSNGTWIQIGNDIDGENAGDFAGRLSLSSDGSILAIGAPLNDGNGNNSGHVRVFENINGIWTQIGNDIDGSMAGDQFGDALSLSSDGSILAVGSQRSDVNGSNSGQVRVFENINGTWTQIGSDINGQNMTAFFGNKVSLSSDGSILAVGAGGNNAGTSDTGDVRVFENINGTWTQLGNDIEGETPSTHISSIDISLSSNGTILAVAVGQYDGNGIDSGRTRVFENINGTWTQIGNDIYGQNAEDFSGTVSLSSDGSILAIGASSNDVNGASSGHIRVFKNTNGSWTQIGVDINGENSSDYLGAVSLSSDGSVLATGASGYDGNGANSGLVRVYSLANLLSTNEIILNTVNIYPVPSNHVLNVSLTNNAELNKIKIYDSSGQFIFEDNKKRIDISNLSSGVYFMEINTNTGKVIKKIIKN